MSTSGSRELPLLLSIGVISLVSLGSVYCSQSSVGIDDIFIGVKTTAKNHQSRIPVLLKTWITLSPSRIYVFTDAEDRALRSELGDHLVVTKCGATHSRQHLCCKTGVIIQELFERLQASSSLREKWLCIVDDDNYVNLPVLRQVLSDLLPKNGTPVYAGKPSIGKKISPPPKYSSSYSDTGVQSYWFGTGGAGICMNMAAVEKLRGLLSEESGTSDDARLGSMCNKLGVPDDMALGIAFEVLLGIELTISSKFHSHLESLSFIQSPSDEATLSYSESRKLSSKQVKGFSEHIDPTRFLSLHCAVHPALSWCPTT